MKLLDDGRRIIGADRYAVSDIERLPGPSYQTNRRDVCDTGLLDCRGNRAALDAVAVRHVFAWRVTALLRHAVMAIHRPMVTAIHRVVHGGTMGRSGGGNRLNCERKHDRQEDGECFACDVACSPHEISAFSPRCRLADPPPLHLPYPLYVVSLPNPLVVTNFFRARAGRAFRGAAAAPDKAAFPQPYC